MNELLMWVCFAAVVAFVLVRMIDEPRRHALYKAAVLEAIRAIAPRAYSIAIRDRVREAADLRISTGRLYAALIDLEEEGEIYSEWGERRTPSGPRRRLYFARSPDRNRTASRA